MGIQIGAWVRAYEARYHFLNMSCCPKESWGPIKAGGPETDYVNKGVVENVGEMEVYRVGDSTKCIVWNYHIMGFNGGRARQLVDMIASKDFDAAMKYAKEHGA